MHFMNRLPFWIALELNKKTKSYKDETMYNVIKEKDVAGLLETIDPCSNIIINTPDNELCISRNINGSLSVVSLTDINLSGKKLLINSIVVLEFRPKIKIAAPKGVHVEFKEPVDSIIHNKLYTKVAINRSTNAEQEVSITKIPDYLTYSELMFTIYIDLDQMKKVNPTINIKSGTPLVDIMFQPMYYVGNHTFPNIENVHWLQSTELFKTFTDIY